MRGCDDAIIIQSFQYLVRDKILYTYIDGKLIIELVNFDEKNNSREEFKI